MRHLALWWTLIRKFARCSQPGHIAVSLGAVLIVTTLIAAACSGLVSERPGTTSKSLGWAEKLPGEVGLSWHECELQSDIEEWKQIEICLGHPLPTQSEAERAWAAKGAAGSRELRIGQHAYNTRAIEIPYTPWSIYAFSRDSRPIKVFVSEQSGHDPDISLLSLENRAAWEYADDRRATIIYDGKDLRRVYALDAAYRPYLIAGKLIFVGRKDNSSFIVYDGRRIGPQFDRIMVAYCCEEMLYSARSGEGRYVFWGTRDGRRHIVEVAAAGSTEGPIYEAKERDYLYSAQTGRQIEAMMPDWTSIGQETRPAQPPPTAAVP